MQKGKVVVEGGKQIAEKRREAKGKGEKERYSHLSAEFQRIVRRNKKAFSSEQCKETEENNRIRKTRDLFSAVATVLEKVSFHSNAKECWNYHANVLISHGSKVMLKILFKLGCNRTLTKNLQMYKLDLEKAEEPEIKWPTSVES